MRLEIEHVGIITTDHILVWLLKICANYDKAQGGSPPSETVKIVILLHSLRTFDARMLVYHSRCQEHFKKEYNESVTRIWSVPVLLSDIKLLYNDEHLLSTSLTHVSFSQSEEHKNRPSMEQRRSPRSDSTLMVHLSWMGHLSGHRGLGRWWQPRSSYWCSVTRTTLTGH